MPKGRKTCPDCGNDTGPRAYTCPKCGYIFIKKDVNKQFDLNVSSEAAPKLRRRRKKKELAPTIRKGVKFNWTELKPGDFIRVIGGGPYWPLKNGDEVRLGYGGKFMVHAIDNNGIHAYPADKRNTGHCYIYMGPVINTGDMLKKPHRIRKIKQPKITNFVMSRQIND